MNTVAMIFEDCPSPASSPSTSLPRNPADPVPSCVRAAFAEARATEDGLREMLRAVERERDAARAEADAILRCAAQHARPGSLWQIGSGWCAERLANGYETVHRADSPEAAIRLAAGLAPDAGGGGAR